MLAIAVTVEISLQILYTTGETLRIFRVALQNRHNRSYGREVDALQEIYEKSVLDSPPGPRIQSTKGSRGHLNLREKLGMFKPLG
jgi:hypothetical protein